MSDERYPIIARIRDNQTQEIREYSDNLTGDNDEDGNFFEFWWSEGNASCDCNRGLFFGYAIGLEYDDIPHECGDIRYSVEILDAKNRNVLYSDFDGREQENE